MHTVLLADDEPYILQGLESKLDWGELGFRIVGSASNGLECLELARRLRPELIVTDIRMPGLNGIELLEKIHSQAAPPAVIFISGYSDFQYAQQAIDLDAITYLLKPISREDLRRALTKAKERLEWEVENEGIKKRRYAEDVFDFLTSMPPATDRRVILERLSLRGSHDTFVCVATDGRTGEDIADWVGSGSTESVTLSFEPWLSLHVLDAPRHVVQRLPRTLARVAESLGCAIGLSLASPDHRKIAELLRQAECMYLTTRFAGESGIRCYPQKSEPVLADLSSDFQMLLSSGASQKLYDLLDQVARLYSTDRPSIDEVRELYSMFLLAGERLAADSPETRTGTTPVVSSRQLFRRFARLDRLIDHLRDRVHDLFDQSHLRGNRPVSAATIKQHVRRNLDADLTPGGLAGFFGVDKTQLSAVFRTEADISITEFVQRARMDHACFLLQHTRLRVQEIAEMCGFSDYFYFARLFRRRIGTTASEYRQSPSNLE